jgi:ubiquinone/menaquinone biosynthesis C-methylase UbiE
VATTREEPAPTFDPRRLGRTYDAPAVTAQRSRTRELLGARPGDRVLDLGCGPGHLTTELAADLGPEGRVIALDRQLDMVHAARERATGAGMAGRCALALADAIALPLADDSCDGAVVVQVLEYVPDLARALEELYRVLRPGARAVLVDTDWRSCVWHTDDRDRTDKVLRAWEAHFVHPHLPSSMPRLARETGFASTQVHAVPVVETATEVETGSDTYSHGMAATIARFVGRREPDLAGAWRDDVRSQAAAGTYFFAVTRFATVVTR